MANHILMQLCTTIGVCPFRKNRRKFFNKIKKKKSNWRKTVRCLFVQELLKGSPIGPNSRDPKPLSADILSARKYNRPSEKLTGRGSVVRYSFNPRVSFVGFLHSSARPYSFSFTRHCRQPENGHPLQRICIYMYIHRRHATRKDHQRTFIRAIPARATRSSGQTEI